jgi:hypothetical protein
LRTKGLSSEVETVLSEVHKRLKNALISFRPRGLFSAYSGFEEDINPIELVGPSRVRWQLPRRAAKPIHLKIFDEQEADDWPFGIDDITGRDKYWGVALQKRTDERKKERPQQEELGASA